MTSQDLSDSASSVSASSTNSQLLAFAQVEPRVVTVPYKMLLNAVLADLHFPRAEYRLEMHEDGNVRMIILLKASTLQPQGFDTDMWIYGIWSGSYIEAEDSASFEAIRFLEEKSNVIIKDVNYHRLKHLEEQNESLLQQLKEANQCNGKLARGWFLAVRNMHSFSQQIHNIVVINYSLEDGPMDKIWNTLLCNIADLGYRLRTISLSLEKYLQKLFNHS